jgi:hypothetical protein
MIELAEINDWKFRARAEQFARATSSYTHEKLLVEKLDWFEEPLE